MKFELITNDNKKYYRTNFIKWMEKNYPNIRRPDIICSNIMLSIKNNIGFSINDLILGEILLDEYEKRYIIYFESINRKSPTNHAKVHVWNAYFFLEFINETYTL